MSMTTLAPGRNYAYAEQTRLKSFQYESHEKLDLSYTDKDGRSFKLSIERDVEIRYTTYDRTATLLGQNPGKGNQHGKTAHAQGLKRPSFATHFDEINRMAKQTERLLKDMLFNNEGDAGPSLLDLYLREKGVDTKVQEELHVEMLEIDQTVEIDMDDVDMEYWSVENTAQRIANFGKSLYNGKNSKQAHLDDMLAGIDQGFASAASAFGFGLPDISEQTVDRAKELLTEWANEGSGEKELDLVA